MTEQLTYGLTEKGLQIATSHQIVHAVSARRGAMLDELNQSPFFQVHTRKPGPAGTVVDFDFEKLGEGLSRGRHLENAAKVFGIIQQFEAVATVEGWHDPRINSYSEGLGQLDYVVELERPEGRDAEVSRKIKDAMAYYSNLLYWKRSLRNAENNIRVKVDSQHGISLEVVNSGFDMTMTTNPNDYSPATDRIELRNTRNDFYFSQELAFARLIAFSGLVATLPKPDAQDTLAS